MPFSLLYPWYLAQFLTHSNVNHYLLNEGLDDRSVENTTLPTEAGTPGKQALQLCI